jgi:hypothetical protein
MMTISLESQVGNIYISNKKKDSIKAGHEPARAGLGASLSLARSKFARLGLAHLSHEPGKRARLELASSSVQLELARQKYQEDDANDSYYQYKEQFWNF